MTAAATVAVVAAAEASAVLAIPLYEATKGIAVGFSPNTISVGATFFRNLFFSFHSRSPYFVWV